jgi:hypothetical protein
MQRLIAGAALAVLLAPWVGLAQPQPRDGAMIYGRGNGTCGSCSNSALILAAPRLNVLCSDDWRDRR